MEISPAVMFAVLAAALLHAAWNALLKASADKALASIGQAMARGLIALVLVPFVAAPAPESWPWIAASVIVHVAYFWLLAGAYRWGELSFSYPIMRGTAPAIVALISVPLFAEILPGAELAAIALICAAVLAFAGGSSAGPNVQGRALAFALGNAVVIASYTLIDAHGVRLSGAPIGYALWFFLGNSIVQLSLGVGGHGRQLFAYLRRHGVQAALGGVFTIGAYGTALWAMTQAPVALVATLRETSVVFAALIGALFLGERLTRRRMVATALVFAGLVLLRL
ncbi:MAG TPA: DMT family transporter [Burkholderiales bacterium]|nr:DMT family transporter [Burkholderiales bacterium]